MLPIKTRVLQKHSINTGDCVKYGLIFKASHNTRIVIISFGYVDSIRRCLSNNGKVLFYNNVNEFYKSPILRNLSMDLLVCVVTTTPDNCISIGHEAVLLDYNYTINDIAAETDTITCELLTNLYCFKTDYLS